MICVGLQAYEEEIAKAEEKKSDDDEDSEEEDADKDASVDDAGKGKTVDAYCSRVLVSLASSLHQNYLSYLSIVRQNQQIKSATYSG